MVVGLRVCPLIDSWNKFPLDNLTIAVPILAIFHRTSTRHYIKMDAKNEIAGKRSPFEIPADTVNEDGDEEHGVKIRDRCGGADDSAPGEAHYPIGNIILGFRT